MIMVDVSLHFVGCLMLDINTIGCRTAQWSSWLSAWRESRGARSGVRTATEESHSGKERPSRSSKFSMM
ncbi:unnamed protein product, partial [Schistosoma haematobium]